MKQHILPKQAKEITKEQFYKLFPDLVDRKNWADYHHKKITMGKMMEFLWEKKAPLTVHLVFSGNAENKDESFENLCNVLWEQVKSYV